MKLRQKIAVLLLRAKFRLLATISKRLTAEKAFKLFSSPQKKAVADLPDLFHAAESLSLDFNGLIIQGYRWPKPGKPRILILHGFESTATKFQQYIKSFAQNELEVLAFDAPAHGKSSGTLITAPLYRDFILSIIEKFGPVELFMAHSMAGLALILALEQMNRSLFLKVVLVAPLTESTTAAQNFFDFLRIKNSSVKKHFDQIILEQTGHPLSWFSITRAIGGIRAGILWVHDGQDNITPLSDTAAVRAQNYPGIKFVITNGLGHRQIYRDKKVFEMIINFMNPETARETNSAT